MIRKEVMEKLRFLPLVVLKRFLRNGEITPEEFMKKVKPEYWPKNLRIGKLQSMYAAKGYGFTPGRKGGEYLIFRKDDLTKRMRRFSWKAVENVDQMIEEFEKVFGTNPPVHIPAKVLSWRERQHKGSIMRPKTFSKIKRKGAAKYLKKGVGKKVAGKAYWVTLLRRYLDKHPGDQYVEGVLKKMTQRKYRMDNPKTKRRVIKGFKHYLPGYWLYFKKPDGKYALLTRTTLTKDQVKRFSETKRQEGISTKSVRAVRGRTPREILESKSRKPSSKNPRSAWYVGFTRGTGKPNIFSYPRKPTHASHGHAYSNIIGPAKDYRDAVRIRNQHITT